jgi:hypothetical protein
MVTGQELKNVKDDTEIAQWLQEVLAGAGINGISTTNRPCDLLSKSHVCFDTECTAAVGQLYRLVCT